jgi:hypothetical protein
MKIDATDFRVREGQTVSLQKWPTTVAPMYRLKAQHQELLGEQVAQLRVREFFRFRDEFNTKKLPACPAAREGSNRCEVGLFRSICGD